MFYGDTAASYGDSTQLLYLRARMYAPSTGRFLTGDPSKLEVNSYLYSQANPVNRVDPTGLFSVETIDKNINLAHFAYSDRSKDHSKWGFLALLQYAKNGDFINSGYVSVVGQGIQSEIWTIPERIYEVNCDKIMVGHQFLDQYYKNTVDKSWEPKIWWRDTTSVHYQLSRDGAVPIHFWDGFDNDVGNYPNFKGLSIGVGKYEIGFLTDLDGNNYVSVSGGPSALVGLSYTEGYLCDWSLSSWKCNGGIPSVSDIEAAVAGICAGVELIVLTGMNVGVLCKDISITNWNATAASIFYAGLAVGGGGSVSATIPLSWFGVSPDQRQGWRWVIDTRQRYGWTWNKILAEWFR